MSRKLFKKIGVRIRKIKNKKTIVLKLAKKKHRRKNLLDHMYLFSFDAVWNKRPVVFWKVSYSLTTVYAQASELSLRISRNREQCYYFFSYLTHLSPQPETPTPTMNAVTLSNIQLNKPIFKTQFPSKPTFSKPSIRRRTLRRFIRRSSLVIDTGVDEPGQAFTEEEEAASPTESIARRLILLRHAKSSWRDRSLRGLPIWVMGLFFFF